MDKIRPYQMIKLLNPANDNSTSFIMFKIFQNNSNDKGHYIVSIGDCQDRIGISGSLGTEEKNKKAHRKIDVLIDTLTKLKKRIE